MAKIFAYKKQKRIFALLVVLFLLIVGYSVRASIFEKEWYNLEYGDYKKSPDSWVVTEAKIKDTKTYNGSNDSALTLLDLYQTAIVDVETADGRSHVRKSRGPPPQRVSQQGDLLFVLAPPAAAGALINPCLKKKSEIVFLMQKSFAIYNSILLDLHICIMEHYIPLYSLLREFPTGLSLL